jgi:hypothetical protein
MFIVKKKGFYQKYQLIPINFKIHLNNNVSTLYVQFFKFSSRLCLRLNCGIFLLLNQENWESEIAAPLRSTRT